MVSIHVSVIQRHFAHIFYNLPKDPTDFFKYIIKKYT